MKCVLNFLERFHLIVLEKVFWMKKEILILVYNSGKMISPNVKAKHILQLGAIKHHLSFELGWIRLPVDKVYKDDYFITGIKNTSTIDDLLLITDSQLN